MADEKIKLDLDPQKVLASLNEMAEKIKQLAKDVEESLGKNAPKSIAKLEESAEKGSTKIASFFRDLGHRVKEDLKTAFDASGILAGAKFAEEIGKGVKSVFEMERAFDRLNTRMNLTGKSLADFKKNVGHKVAETGQKLEDILPGVESAASKGGVKSPEQLADIAETLGKAKAITGEEAGGLADSIVEILKSQGKKITAESFKEVMDSLQATRVKGAFKSAGEAGSAVESISGYGKQFGMGTREMGGLAAMSSKAGDSGQQILKKLLDKASAPGQGAALNEILGQKVFKTGRAGEATGINAAALGKVDVKRLGAGSQQVIGELAGAGDAGGADFARFVQAFGSGMEDFNAVVKGTDETATQFKTATDNLASKVEEFKQKTLESGREIGSALSRAGNELLKGNISGAKDAIKDAAKAANENKGTIAAATAITAGVGVLAGGGLNRLLSKVPGGGMLGGMAKGEMAKQAGVQPVYVVNAGEIGGGVGGVLSGGPIGIGITALVAVTGALAAYLGSESASKEGGVFDVVTKAFGGGGIKSQGDIDEAAMRQSAKGYSKSHGVSEEEAYAKIAKAVELGASKAKLTVKNEGPLTNPSSVQHTSPSGGHR